MSPSSPPALECRICRDTSAAQPLLQPCLCASHVHQACLKQWTASRTSTTDLPLTSPGPPSCEVCLAPYKAKSTSGDGPPPPLVTSARDYLIGPDPLSLLPPFALCSTVVSLEACVLLCLFVLAVSGHTFFLFHIYTPTAATPGVGEYAAQRVLLAVVNACLTFGILALVRKIAGRWLRESAPASDTSSSATTLPHTLSNASSLSASGGLLPMPATSGGLGAGVSSYAGHVTLGGFLSLVAGAEVYLLVSAL